MRLIVQKYGGTSVGSPERIRAVARRLVDTQREGCRVVAVISAMAGVTDNLIKLACDTAERPAEREFDVLLATGEHAASALTAIAVNALGGRAISLTGAEAGVLTDRAHTRAKIANVSPRQIQDLLAEDFIVIVAGFQGQSAEGATTTLGRGGSDLSAIALAGALNADACEIYTDVDGVYTTDPRLVPEARRMQRISYDEMLELASLGAAVMHNRSIEFAKKFSVPIHVRTSFSDIPGTMIVSQPEALDQPVAGAALVRGEARVTVLGVPDRPGSSLAIFSKIAEQVISVDMIVQNIGAEGIADISFTVDHDDLPVTLKAVSTAAEQLGAEGVVHDDDVAKVSIVGLGMAKQTGVATRMFRALADAEINIAMISTSEIKVSVLVARGQGVAALRTVHQAFELDKPPGNGAPAPLVKPTRSNDAVAIISRLQKMEELAIDDIALDESQARLTVSQVADRPGLAAAIFDAVAEAGIFVDMIVQSFGRQGKANLSFTVPQTQYEKSLQLLKPLAAKLKCGPVTSSPRVAKLAVSGIGMRSHGGVAIRVFESLARSGINVDMINTSEVRVNVVVEGQPAAGLCRRPGLTGATIIRHKRSALKSRGWSMFL